MRHSFFVSALMLMWTMAAQVAGAEEPWRPWYASIYGGIAFPQTLSDVQRNGTSYSDIALRSGLVTGMKLGFSPTPDMTWVNWELEGFYSSPHPKNQTVTNSNGGSRQITYTRTRFQMGAFNFVVRYPYGSVQPYVGAGPAHLWVRGTGDGGQGHDLAWGGNFLVGIRFRVSDHIFGYTEYKHIRGRADFVIGNADIRLHAAVFGLGIAF
jgi:Outer membrane protein beta-barrel domain